jgi:hypothetical protein
VFGLPSDADDYFWPERPMRRLELAYRHDGFTPWYDIKPPATPQEVAQRFIDPFAGTNVKNLVWGLGPGSVFCFETKVGTIAGEGLSEAQWKLLRDGDRFAYENVTGLIRSGHPPLRTAVEWVRSGAITDTKSIAALFWADKIASGAWK